MLVRTGVEPLSRLRQVRSEIWAVDRNVAPEGYLQQVLVSRPKFGLILLGVFATVGLALVAIEVFSVVATRYAPRPTRSASAWRSAL